jgi:hypothetical protein
VNLGANENGEEGDEGQNKELNNLRQILPQH